MKVELISNGYIIYLNQFNLINIDFNAMDILEDNFKKLIKKLNTYYHIDINGYYNINVYLDKYYGAILQMEKEDIGYYDYFDNDTIAMRIKKIETSFLYEVDDTLFAKNFFNKFKLITKNNHIYLKIIDDLSYKEYLLLTEMSKIIYDKHYVS